MRGETSLSTEPCTSFGIGWAAVLESDFRVPAAPIFRGCQFRRLLSQTRPARGLVLGWLCLQCLQGKLKGLLGQRKKGPQDHCTELLKSCL